MALSWTNSDTLRITLPSESLKVQHSSQRTAFLLLSARQLVESFGDIAHLEKCPGDENTVIVTYFDLRAAACARQALPDSSEWEEPRGTHELRFTQEELQTSVMTDMAYVSSWTKLSLNDDGTFTVRFVDSRTALQAEAMRYMSFGTSPLKCPEDVEVKAAQQNKAEEPVKIAEKIAISQAPTADTLSPLTDTASEKGVSSCSSDAGSSPAGADVDTLQSTILELLQEERSRGQQSQEPLYVEPPAAPECEVPQGPATVEGVKPKYVNDLRQTALSWGDLASKKEKRTTLRLRCLPQRLCAPGALESLLEAHQLLDLVEKVRVVSTGSQGGAGRRLNMGSALLKAKSVDDVPRLAKFFHGRPLGGSTPVSVSFAVDQGLMPSRAKATRNEPCYILTPLKAGGSECLDAPPGLEQLHFPPGLAF